MSIAAERRRIIFRMPPWILILAVVICLPGSLSADPPPADTPDPFAKHHRLAKAYYHNFSRLPYSAEQKPAWLKVAYCFQTVSAKTADQNLAADALFTLGILYEDLFRRSQDQADLKTASYFHDKLVDTYPASELADDSLFALAQIMSATQKDSAQTRRLLTRITTSYPDSDTAPQARQRLAELDASATPAMRPASPAMAEKTQAASTLGDITSIRHSFADGKVRVVIESSRPTSFQSHVLPASETDPARLYLDFADTAIRDKALAATAVNNPVLQQIRSAQYTKETVRVVLDTRRFSGYEVSSQTNPFRVIVDLWDESAAPVPPAAVAATASGKKNSPADEKKIAPATDSKKTPAEPKQVAAAEVKKTVQVLDEIKKTTPAEVKPFVQTGGKKIPTDDNKGAPAAKATIQPLKVIIDPGHGGKDPGTISASGIKEKDIVLKVAQSLASELQRQPTSFRIFLTRDSDRYLSLDERTEFANRMQGDLFISIHVNSHTLASVHGVETYFLSMTANGEELRAAAQENASSQSQFSELQTILQDLAQNSKMNDSARLAEAVQAAIVGGLSRKYSGIRSLGVKKAPFIVLVGAQMPAILTEIAFLSNADEATRLQDNTYLAEVAGHIADGVGRFASSFAQDGAPARTARYALDTKSRQVQVLP